MDRIISRQAQTVFDSLIASEKTANHEALLAGIADADIVHVTGIGKSGAVADLFSRMLKFTGKAAHFLNPVDALHGDVGAVRSNDLLVMISKSGSTAELLRLADVCPCDIIAVVFEQDTALGRKSAVRSVVRLALSGPEVCPSNIYPLTSTAVQVAYLNAIVAGHLGRSETSAYDLVGRTHPGGRIGESLATRGDS